MPIITIQLLEGRTDAQKRALFARVTDAVVETAGAKPENVTIVLEEMRKENYGTGGKRAADE